MPTHPAIQEVIDLHDFFEQWLTGVLPASDAAFARFTTVTAPEFTLISPEGKRMGHAVVADWIRSSHGARPGFRLWTTDHSVRYEDAHGILVTYQEWQERHGATTCRISSAFFTAHVTAPNRWIWRHVHETWITPG